MGGEFLCCSVNHTCEHTALPVPLLMNYGVFICFAVMSSLLSQYFPSVFPLGLCRLRNLCHLSHYWLYFVSRFAALFSRKLGFICWGDRTCVLLRKQTPLLSPLFYLLLCQNSFEHQHYHLSAVWSCFKHCLVMKGWRVFLRFHCLVHFSFPVQVSQQADHVTKVTWLIPSSVQTPQMT